MVGSGRSGSAHDVARSAGGRGEPPLYAQEVTLPVT